jgi:polysaccharide export outer membrane protein
MTFSFIKSMEVSAAIFLLVLASHSTTAQQAASSAPAPDVREATSNGSPVKTPAPSSDMRYRIGPGDVLEVRVARAPELSREAVRVDQGGFIRMPMLEVDIQAACLTEAEVAQNIATLYRKYKNNPHVDVFVKEFQSQPVAVIGAVRAPAQFKLQRQVKLHELLSLVGGPNDTAGQTVQIVHAAGQKSCEQTDTQASDGNDTSAFVTYKLEDTLHGVAEANPVVQPGDIVSVPQADQVFVLGNVLKPTAIAMKEPITVLKAIALAGGTAPSTKKDKVRIIRQLPGSTKKQEILVDLVAIEKNRAEDVQLVANDIVDVPVSGTKRLLRSLLGTVVPSVAQLPIRVIP